MVNASPNYVWKSELLKHTLFGVGYEIIIPHNKCGNIVQKIIMVKLGITPSIFGIIPKIWLIMSLNMMAGNNV